jgi:aryl-phospho-beta-D-glucosidase BglC (GH1 family)
MRRRRFLKLLALGAAGFTGLTGLSGCLRERPRGYLRVDGDRLLDHRGVPVLLRGFNTGFRDFKNVLGEEDIARIRGMGGNCLRLWYEYTDFEEGPYEYRGDAFSLLDRVLGWCSSHGVYVVLCNHHAPGGQNPHDFVVSGGTYSFWREEENQERFYALWSEIARRYSGEKIIAGYDLLNEGVPPSLSRYVEVMEKAARAVRSHDGNHALVVEEARIPLGNGNQRLVLLPIRDGNVLYSVHFFYPPQFTFYTTTSTGDRTTTTYPGEMAVAGERLRLDRSEGITGSHGWRKAVLTATPPAGAEVMRVSLVSRNNRGKVWFDDVELRGRETVDLPAPMVSNPSFEIDHAGFNWETRGGGVEVALGEAHTGARALIFSGTREAFARSSPISVGAGGYELSAWVKAENATGDNYLAVSWHRAKVIARLNRAQLAERLQYAFNFRSRHGAPILVGEFTAHANPSMTSVVNYLRDVLDIMEENGLHWCYWSYYSHLPGIGVYSGSEPYLSRPEAVELLRGYMGGHGADFKSAR